MAGPDEFLLVDASRECLSGESINLLQNDTSSGLSESFATSNPLDALAWMENISGIDQRVNYPASFILSISMSGMEDSDAIRQIVSNMIAQEAIDFGGRIIGDERIRGVTDLSGGRTIAQNWIGQEPSLGTETSVGSSFVATAVPEPNAAILAGIGALVSLRRRR